MSLCQYSVITRRLLLSSNSLLYFIYTYHTIMFLLYLKPWGTDCVYIFKIYVIFIYYNVKDVNRKSLWTFLSVFFFCIYLEFNVYTSCIFDLIIYYHYLVIVGGSFYHNDYTETASHCTYLSINIYKDYYYTVVLIIFYFIGTYFMKKKTTNDFHLILTTLWTLHYYALRLKYIDTRPQLDHNTL